MSDDDDAPDSNITSFTAVEKGVAVSNDKAIECGERKKRGWSEACVVDLVNDDTNDTDNNSPLRRSSGRDTKKIVTNPTKGQSNLLSFPNFQEGSQSELNRLMKRKDGHSNRMRQTIIFRAVLARKKDTLERDYTFTGSDGRVYPNLRLAFGKHVDMKPCALCKSRVQGHWFCRIANAHIDKPDHDGGNSSEILMDPFSYTIDELEERLWDLMHRKGGNQKGTREKKDDSMRASSQSKTAHIDTFDKSFPTHLLNEDILYQIASFIPCLKDLASFCRITKRCQQLMNDPNHSETLLRGVFLRAFGIQGTKGNFEVNLTWKQRWIMIRNLRRGLMDRNCIQSLPIKKSSSRRALKNTIDVLSEREESEAIYYDNPDYAEPDTLYSNGYFGMEILRLPVPPNASSDWQAPIVVRGDFDGIEISKPNSLFYKQSSKDNKKRKNIVTTSSFSLGDEEGAGQVLSLIQYDLCLDAIQSAQAEGRCPPPCCYLGYASGKVASVTATLTPERDDYTFTLSGMHHAHESEVTDMTFVNCGKSPHEDVPILFSACCAGKVYFYPHALNSDQKYSLEQSVLAFSNYYDCPIFSMTSTSIVSNGKFFSILCTGDRDGHVRMWLKHEDDLLTLCTRTGHKFRHLQCYKSSTQSRTGHHLVTRSMFTMNNKLLITATNNGDVRFWQLNCVENTSRAIGKGPLPNLTLRYDLMNIHSGAIELLMVVGDILLTSGGNDGKIIGWDISTGLKLGHIRCHVGREIEERGTGVKTIRSCVVDVLLSGKEKNMLSLCRDGRLKQLRFV